MPLNATIRRLVLSEHLPRSSHTLNVVNCQGYVFGGEHEPRQPVDAFVKTFSLSKQGESDYMVETIKSSDAPPARVGHATASVDDKILVFGGRGGKDMKPLDEKGQVWIFCTVTGTWSSPTTGDTANYPEGRSYHSATSSNDTFYIHAGCPASGRTTDVWGYQIANKVWHKLPDAPEPARGGPGFVYALGRLWRFGGFDGKQELGGQLDFLDLSNEKNGWQTVTFRPEGCPGNRSVSGLQSCTVGGSVYLLAYLGERDASYKGHDGAGTFWNDIWSLQINEDGVPADAWEKCGFKQGLDPLPARGWFASDRMGDKSIVLFGGLNDKNERESDGYLITFEENATE